MTLADAYHWGTEQLDTLVERVVVSRTNVYALLGALLTVDFGTWLVQYLSVLRQVHGLPTLHSAIEFFESSLRTKLPHIPFAVPVNDYTILEPWKKYEHFRTDLFACTQLSTPSYAVYVTSNLRTAELLSSKTGLFDKPIEMFRYTAINIFGLVITSCHNGPEHRRHKGVVKACFNEKVMVTVWDMMKEAFEVMKRQDKLEEGGVVHDVLEDMIKLTLYTFGRAGYDIDIPWEITQTKSGEDIPFAEALQIVENSMIPQLLVPLWILCNFPLASVRRLGQAQKSFLSHLKTMYDTKRAELSQRKLAHFKDKRATPTNILDALVASQMDHEAEARLDRDKGKAKVVGLSEKEIIGNIWIFLLAGHETTAHTLTFLHGYLALYPEWQDKLYYEIVTVCGDEELNYRHMPQLNLCLASCFETVRLRDVVMTLPKIAMEDTVLPYTRWDAAGNVTHHTHHIKKGSHVIIDTPAAALNPFVWADPNTFDPSRFIDPATGRATTSINGFMGFSSGPRQCIGKRFAEVEMVSYLAHLVKEYKIHPIPKEGESWAQMRDRVLRGTEELTLTPKEFGIRLEKRQ